MAAPGSDVGFAVTVAAPPIQVAQTLSQSLYSNGNYADDVQVVPVGPTTYRITRTYLPTWTIVVAILGFLLCLVGLLALLLRDTEVLVVDIQPDGDGSIVTVSGRSNGATVTTIQSTLARFGGYAETQLAGYTAYGAGAVPGPYAAAETTSTSVGNLEMSPDRYYWWDGAAWQSVMDSTPPHAQRSPDGTQWWDGAEWRPVA